MHLAIAKKERNLLVYGFSEQSDTNADLFHLFTLINVKKAFVSVIKKTIKI